MIGFFFFVWYSVYSNKEESCCLMYNGLDECDKVVCHEYSISTGILIKYICLGGLSRCHMTEGAVREMRSVVYEDGSGLLQACLVFDSGLFLMIKSGLEYSQTLDTPTRSTFYMLFML